MLLQTRTVTFKGSPRKIMPWAIEITNYVNTHSGLQVALWAADYGHPIGTIGWSTRMETQAAWQAAATPLQTDGGYMDLIDAVDGMVDVPGNDRLMEVIYGNPTEPPPIGATLVATQAVAAVDQLGAALAWSVGIGQHGESVTGRPVSVTLDVYGQMGTIGWLSWAPTVSGAEEARTKLHADPSYAAKMAETKSLFIPGTGTVFQYTRIA